MSWTTEPKQNNLLETALLWLDPLCLTELSSCRHFCPFAPWAFLWSLCFAKLNPHSSHQAPIQCKAQCNSNISWPWFTTIATTQVLGSLCSPISNDVQFNPILSASPPAATSSFRAWPALSPCCSYSQTLSTLAAAWKEEGALGDELLALQALGKAEVFACLSLIYWCFPNCGMPTIHGDLQKERTWIEGKEVIAGKSDADTKKLFCFVFCAAAMSVINVHLLSCFYWQCFSLFQIWP